MSSGNVSERMAISFDGGGQGTCSGGEHVAAALASVESDGCAQTFGAESGYNHDTMNFDRLLAATVEPLVAVDVGAMRVVGMGTETPVANGNR